MLGAGGRPVAGATVYVLPKRLPGGSREDFPHRVTDAQGRWQLRVRQVHECWIGAQAHAHKIAWLDGTQVDPNARMVHVLEPAQPRRVTVTDPLGRPLSGVGVELIPWPLAQHHELPAPGRREPGSWVVTDARGEATVYLATPGPALVRPAPEGRTAEPEVGWLAPEADALAFRADLACTLALCLEDAERLEPLSGLATLWLRPHEPGRLARAATVSVSAGLGCVERTLPAGTYDLLAEVEGREPLLVAGLDLAAPGSVREVRALVARAPEPGRLLLELSDAPARGLFFFARARGGPRALLGWRAVTPADPGAAPLSFRLAPGRYDLLAAAPALGRCGLLHDVAVEAGRATPHALALAPGARVEVATLADAVRALRRFEVEAEGLGPLPAYGLAPGSLARKDAELVDLAADAGGRDAWLGPFPADRVRVRAVRWHGPPADFEVGR